MHLQHITKWLIWDTVDVIRIYSILLVTNDVYPYLLWGQSYVTFWYVKRVHKNHLHPGTHVCILHTCILVHYMELSVNIVYFVIVIIFLNNYFISYWMIVCDWAALRTNPTDPGCVAIKVKWSEWCHCAVFNSITDLFVELTALFPHI